MEIFNVAIGNLFERGIVLTYDGPIEAEKYAFLSFEYNANFYDLVVYRNDESWFPASVRHFYQGTCPYCTGQKLRGSLCSRFDPFLNEVFQKVMNHPSIRLRKIFF